MGRLKSLKGNVVKGLQSIEWVVFLLEFYVCHRVSPKHVFLLLTQEPIYTIEFRSLATTKRRKIIRVQTVRVTGAPDSRRILS